MNKDKIIQEYIGAQANNQTISRQLSDDFHKVFRQTIELAKLRGDISFDEPTPDFWKNLIDQSKAEV